MRDETEQIQQTAQTEQMAQVERAAAQPTVPLPALGAFVVDTRFAGARAGRVAGHEAGAGTVRLVPPGGGAWWNAPRADLRPPTVEEWARIRVLITPVRPLRREDDEHQRCPDRAPVVLTAGAGPDPEPVEGCALCALLARWRAELREGPGADWSAATDCSVEIGNHPHTPPKLTAVFPSPLRDRD
ncbi:hypothetical protein [Streptomyces sp. CC208A]|uniref:hypothetical protein n=1 Tax=Streptomyces sp. CC208A TaxID=3044573 RepID=UPI0024A8F74E|nr:hypothetical protein [Streptomyces sp. CC208A]